jgi:hypothetical protein
MLQECIHSRAKWPERPQLKQVCPEVVLAVGVIGRHGTGGGGGRTLDAAC